MPADLVRESRLHVQVASQVVPIPIFLGNTESVPVTQAMDEMLVLESDLQNPFH
jgi:hypothetical protein